MTARLMERSAVQRTRGLMPDSATSPVVPVRLSSATAAFRVHLPNGVIVEVPAHVEGSACATVLECASRLS